VYCAHATARGAVSHGAITLRPAGPADEPFLRDLYAAVRAPELAPVPWSDGEKRAFCDMQYSLQERYYRQQFARGAFQVVEESGAPIGRLYVARTGAELRIVDIALIPAARNRGVGTALVTDILRVADRDGLAASLVTERENPARRLYARLGFVVRDEAELHVELARAPARPLTRGD
jgi:ribosomal protein S18 acetylase RimI-like enzyme